MTRSKLSATVLIVVAGGALAGGCGSKKQDPGVKGGEAGESGDRAGQKSAADPGPSAPAVVAPRVPDTPPVRLEPSPGKLARTYAWARGIGGVDTDAARGVAIDAAGKVAVAGYVRGSVDLGDGRTREAADADAFVTLYGPDGQVAWALSFGGKDEDVTNAVAFTPAGGVVAAGQYAYEAEVGDLVMTSAGSDDAFVVSMRPDGQVAWAFRVGGNDSDGANDVAVDAAGNVFVTGSFKGTVEVGEQKLASRGNEDIFVAKLTPAGELAWIRHFGGRYPDAGERIAADSRGDVVLLARFRGDVAFGGATLEPEGNQDLAVVKLDADGRHLWSQRFGSPFNELGLGLAVDPADNIAFTGSFDQEIRFDDQELRSAGESDVFVARMNPNGLLLWVKRFGGRREDIGAGISADQYGNLAVTGWFRDRVDFGGGPLEAAADNKDAFLVVLSPEGAHRWSRRFGDRDHDQGRGVAMNPAGQTALIGVYRFALDLGGPALESARRPGEKAPPPDGFVAVFTP